MQLRRIVDGQNKNIQILTSSKFWIKVQGFNQDLWIGDLFEIRNDIRYLTYKEVNRIPPLTIKAIWGFVVPCSMGEVILKENTFMWQLFSDSLKF